MLAEHLRPLKFLGLRGLVPQREAEMRVQAATDVRIEGHDHTEPGLPKQSICLVSFYTPTISSGSSGVTMECTRVHAN